MQPLADRIYPLRVAALRIMSVINNILVDCRKRTCDREAQVARIAPAAKAKSAPSLLAARACGFLRAARLLLAGLANNSYAASNADKMV